MVCMINCAGLWGINAHCVSVEVDIREGFPGITMVGYLSPEVKEAQDRVCSALRNSGYKIPPKKITINLSPADLRKDGTGYDLAIAVAILSGLGVLAEAETGGRIFLGELGLGGEIKPVKGILPLLLVAQKSGIHTCFVAEENMNEARVIPGLLSVAVKQLTQVVAYLKNCKEIPDQQAIPVLSAAAPDRDYAEVNGQFVMKRATEVAVAGYHNILYLGPPGTGKTMIANRIPTIMPDMTKQEQLDISKIYSICGLLTADLPLVRRRPFRSPFQTISPYAFAGGGSYPKPGEFSLAHHGVLFLDEMAEFKRPVLELLRQPLEYKKILISRLHGTYVFPADFLLAGTMNPCPCGYFPNQYKCRCSPAQVKRYLMQISRPLLDRIEICTESSAVYYEDLRHSRNNESSAVIKQRIEKAWLIQKQRFVNREHRHNSGMTNQEVAEFCRLGEAQERLLKRAFEQFGLSGRACYKILKLGRTIADLEQSGEILEHHLSEAISYRTIEEKYWGNSYE